jgi:class 3 adenylate cyclase
MAGRRRIGREANATPARTIIESRASRCCNLVFLEESVSIDPAQDENAALASAWRLQRTGNFVAAFDRAQEALGRFPDSQALAYVSVLALASCGSTEAALQALHASSLGANLAEDSLALEARLLKDLAFGRRADSETMLRRAAQAYEEVARRTDGTYSRQNAAMLWMLAGDAPRAEHLARGVTERLAQLSVPDEPEDAYFHWATLAEAALVLGDRVLLESAVIRANPLCRRNSWARSRTFLQLRRLQSARPHCADLVGGWYRPAVGLLLPSEGLPARFATSAALESSDLPALVYCAGGGARSGWQDLVAGGIPLHLIYPGARDDESNPPAPTVRYRRDASGFEESHTWSSLLLDEDDDHDRICAEVALGLSLGHAEALSSPWTALSQSGGSWRTHLDPNGREAAIASQAPAAGKRSRYAFLFADVVSYSSLNAAETRRYWQELLPKTAAQVLRRHSASIVLRKTWGDAVHAVFRTAGAAAAAALEMQAATAQLAQGPDPGQRLSFRVGVHYGAADQGYDPVEEVATVFGPQLSLAARIVPVAPPGGAFATEPFAAQLSLEGAVGVHCSYVGTTSLAKSYGRLRLLTLT